MKGKEKERERRIEREKRGKGERQRLSLQKKKESEKRGGGASSTSLLGKGEIGSERSLSLKGMGYPGDRAGQQNYNIQSSMKSGKVWLQLTARQQVLCRCILASHLRTEIMGVLGTGDSL